MRFSHVVLCNYTKSESSRKIVGRAFFKLAKKRNLMDLLLALVLPILALVAATLILANKNKKQLREKLFDFEMSGKSSQIWNFTILSMATISIVIYFSKR